jgi:CheY-like chemotaxis protein
LTARMEVRRSAEYREVMVSPHAGGRPVLVVEDDDDIRDVLQTALEAEGYAVRTAVNGRDALDQLRAAPDACLVLLDLMMPVMGGRQFCVEQHQDPVLAQIPVVVVSAAAGPLEDVMTLGVQAVVRKPIDLDQLLAVVERHRA